MSSRQPIISVLTPTIPERKDLLAECRASVVVQTTPDGRDFEHLILEDTDREGCAITMNRLAKDAQGDWLLPLADDDLLLPGCLKRLLAASAEADIVYPRPVVWGEPDGPFVREPPNIPSLALIRTDLWTRLGGYNEHLTEKEDNDLWLRAEGMARFVCYDAAPTWVYRFHVGRNKSRNGGVSS